MQNQESNVVSINSARHVKFIRAGAGAGKTTNLIATCIDYIVQFHNQHKRFPKVIITTFTTKATQEIKERLLLKALDLNDQSLFQHMSQKNGVHIGTIHSVLSLLLRQTAELLGLTASFQIRDDSVFYQHCKKIFKKEIINTPEYLELLNHYHFSDLIQMLYTFSNKKLEFLNLEPALYADLKIKAHEYNQSYLKVIDRYLENKDRYPSSWQSSTIFLAEMQIALRQQDLNLLQRCFDHYKPAKKFTFKKDQGLSEEDNELIADLFKADCFNGSSFESTLTEFARINSLFFELGTKIERDLLSYKKEMGYISIADLELLSKKILNEFPDDFRTFARQFDYVMIDEYQDTSPIQVELLNALVESKSHFIVGDPQQSIYLFRGARSEVFNIKEQEFKNKKLNIEILDTNYRSSARLMSFINEFFNLYSNQFLPMKYKDQDFTESTGAEAYFVTAESSYDAIFGHIQYLVSLNVPYSDITVLFKKNDQILNFARESFKKGLPVQVQIAKGFDDKPEIIDLVSILKFVINPYDNENLIQVLRMPWFKTTDQQLIDLSAMVNKPIWSQLKDKSIDDFELLKKIEDTYLRFGLSQCLDMFVTQTVFLQSALYFDSSTRRESNIWKFIQTVAEKEKDPDFNVSTFINKEFSAINQDLSASTGEAIPLVAANRVSLMTVHGSKGLQFEHVIIAGLEDQVKRQSVSALCIDETQQKFCLKILTSQDADKPEASHWAEDIADMQTERLLQENDRLLYVAVTRAKSSVCLARRNKKASKNTWLEKIKWSEDSYNNNTYKVSFSEIDHQDFKFMNSETKAEKHILPLSQGEDKAKDKIAITDLIQNTDASKDSRISSQTIKNYYVKNSLKAQKGTELHRFFESMKYKSVNSLTEHLDPESQKALVWMQEQTELPLLPILENGYVEMGFGLNLKLKDDSEHVQSVQGQIDAWGVYQDQIYVIDYKTGSDQYLDKAIKQLNFYALCLKKMNFTTNFKVTNPKVHLVVIYPYDQKMFIKTMLSSEIEKELGL